MAIPQETVWQPAGKTLPGPTSSSWIETAVEPNETAPGLSIGDICEAKAAGMRWVQARSLGAQ
jgi:tRNA isopentenyl-2-thiomethyl-A-37 hydroxylase MiaE